MTTHHVATGLRCAPMIAGLVAGADSLAAAATRLAAEPDLHTAHELIDQARAYLNGAERLARVMIETTD